jgi:CDP-2,3-bis-(O-geranylgeranyl)-sn-glycerol synthase
LPATQAVVLTTDLATAMIDLGLLLLILVANAAPVLAKDLLGPRWCRPVDLGRNLPDGRRLLGDACTYRGWVAAVLATTLAAALLGLSPGLGAGVATLAMAGDAASCFVKRRLGLAPGTMALGLDQIPESLLPLLWVRERFGLGWGEILGLVAAFFVVELLLSRLAYRWRLREHPY